MYRYERQTEYSKSSSKHNRASTFTKRISFIRETASIRVSSKQVEQIQSVPATYEDGTHDPNDNLRNTGVNDESLENPGNRLAYKDMPAFTYYFSTIITIVIFAIIGAYVKQISLATELISDIGVVYVSYI